jgi:hypothetical protein
MQTEPTESTSPVRRKVTSVKQADLIGQPNDASETDNALLRNISLDDQKRLQRSEAIARVRYSALAMITTGAICFFVHGPRYAVVGFLAVGSAGVYMSFVESGKLKNRLE